MSNWKERLQNWADQTKNTIKTRLDHHMTEFEPAGIAEWASSAVQGQGKAFYLKIISVILCSCFMADIVSLWVGPFVPEALIPKTSRFGTPNPKRVKSLEDYSI